MKKSILLFAMILVGLSAFSQSTYNLVIFSEDGEPFYAYANGIRQNDKPETNVRIVGLNSENLAVKIQFENKTLPVIKQNMYLEFGYEHTANLRQNMKKVMKMQYFGKVSLAEAPKSEAATVQYHTAENPVNTTGTPAASSDVQHSTTTVTHATSTQTAPTPGGASVNVNMGGVGISMNVNDNMGNSTTTHSHSSTTVTSSSSSSHSGGIKNPSPGSDASIQPVSNGGCSAPMNSASYEKMKKSVESKPFSDTKMSTAKVATKNACLSAAQIKGICSLFAMDDDKLTYAKFAYDYCTDKANYYEVSEVFSFSSTTDDLNKFLETK
jgi:hypothetical protein